MNNIMKDKIDKLNRLQEIIKSYENQIDKDNLESYYKQEYDKIINQYNKRMNMKQKRDSNLNKQKEKKIKDMINICINTENYNERNYDNYLKNNIKSINNYYKYLSEKKKN
jgi:hypothetical protein